MIPTALDELRRWERLLVDAGFAALALGFVVLAAGLLFDERLILGINPWIKPSKFLFSFWVYFWTVAWLLSRVQAGGTARTLVRHAVLWTMLVEGVLIGLQSARGVPSHFNATTVFDHTVYRLMGIAIVLNTLTIGGLLALFMRPHPQVDWRLTLGIRAGLIAFLLGCLVTVPMLLQQAHTVGAPDGGPGLPYLNWSIRYGDLRPAHFVGVHGLQILPAIGWWASHRSFPPPTVTLGAGLMLYVGLFGWTLSRAIEGEPLLAWSGL